MITEPIARAAPHPLSGSTPDRDNALRAKAAEFETAFLAEMLGHAGLGAMSEEFGGGVGEEQFSSFLRQEQAAQIVKSGGIGLAESVFQSLAGHQDAN